MATIRLITDKGCRTAEVRLFGTRPSIKLKSA
jgi:hypothetical protein